MANINLLSEQLDPIREPSSRKGILILIFIFLLLVIAYLGLIFFKGQMNSKASKVDSEYAAQNKKLTEGDNLEVIDFQNRINAARVSLAEKDKGLETLQKMETLVVSEAYISSYTYDTAKKSLDLLMIGNNFNVAAKQILSFKSAGYFSDVSSEKSEIIEGGKVKFDVKLKLK